VSPRTDELQKKLQDPESPSRTLGEHVSLLVDLGLPKQDLQATMLKAYRTKFTKVSGCVAGLLKSTHACTSYNTR
jgi:hypothetical protein